jgi:AraC-like DNA-binding protein
MELIINLREEPRHTYDHHHHRPLGAYRGSWVSGAQSSYLVIDTAPDASMIGVHFKPGGASWFFNRPASELAGTVVGLDALWNREAELLREELLDSPTPTIKLRVLEAALRRRITRLPPRHPSVSYALSRLLDRPNEVTIGHLSATIGMSPRRFIEIFRYQVGLTPKLFSRVRRFQRILRSIEKCRAVEWADVAAAGGYYDQAHFIHDFREFCGLTPSLYVNETVEYPNFVPLRQ